MSKKLRKLISLLCGCLLFAACSDPSKTTYEYMDHMIDNPAVKAQEQKMRVPPVGTLPRGFTPYPYSKEEGDLAGAHLTNPLSPTTETFLKGQVAYDTFCIVCHGKTGVGDGSIVPKFPRPPYSYVGQGDQLVGWKNFSCGDKRTKFNAVVFNSNCRKGSLGHCLLCTGPSTSR